MNSIEGALDVCLMPAAMTTLGQCYTKDIPGISKDGRLVKSIQEMCKYYKHWGYYSQQTWQKLFAGT